MNSTFSLTLASKSPRRQFLLKEAGFDFKVKSIDTDESFPRDLNPTEVALYIAKKKAAAYKPSLSENELVITADTVVILHDNILGKPLDVNDAERMLSSLSGQKHQVITGVCLLSLHKTATFDDTTDVWFKSLSKSEIAYYLQKYKPFDKAGAYGAQEWLGMIAIERMEGSYFNVMGLPIHKLYKFLNSF